MMSDRPLVRWRGDDGTRLEAELVGHADDWDVEAAGWHAQWFREGKAPPPGHLEVPQAGDNPMIVRVGHLVEAELFQVVG